MDTVDFLAHVLPRQGYKFAVMRPAEKEFWVHRAHEDVATLATDIAKGDARHADVFFACAGFEHPVVETVRSDGSIKKQYRTQSNAAWVRALWLDLDCGESKAYQTQQDALTDTVRMSEAAGLPLPTAVSSGYGLHCYWVFTEDIPAATWSKLALLWRSVVDYYDVRHDSACTSDVCRILRPVGTHNRKRGLSAEVRIMGAVQPPTDVKQFAGRLAALTKEHGITPKEPPKKTKVANTLNSELSGGMEYPDADAALIAGSCAQVANFRASRGDVPEPMWYAMLGLIKHTVDGEAVCHDWSEGHETYDYTVTQRKIEQWQHGPTTCTKLEMLDAKGCDGCPSRGKLSSPIQLGTVVPPTPSIVEVNTATATPETTPELPPSIAANFAWIKGEMVAYVKDEETGARHKVPFCDFLLYPTSYHTADKLGGEKELKSSWTVRVKEGVFKHFTVDGASVGVGGRDLSKVLGEQGVFSRPGAKKYMERYVTDWFTKLRQDSDEVKAFATFGWHGDSFLIGNDLYQPDGTIRQVRVHGDATKYEAAFARDGNLDAWVEDVNTLYNRPNHEQFQWMLCVGFGAPLVKLLGPGMAGCTVHGYSSDSGFGKSTAGKLALGMYGHPDRLALTKQQVTAKGLFAYCGVMNALPILLDEITNAKGPELSEMVYTFSQGTGRLGAQSDGSLRNNVYEWASLLTSTANRSLHDALTANNSDSRPEIARAFEYRYTKLENQLDKISADFLVPKIMLNSGSAGRAFIQYLVCNRAAVERLLVATRTSITQRVNASSDERYWLAATATILTGAMIASKLGLIRFDVAALAKWALSQFIKMRKQVVDTTPDLTEHFGAMLNELSISFLVTNIEGDSRSGTGRAVVIHPPRGELTGRVVNESNVLYLPVSAARTWCNDNRVDYRQLLESLVQKEWVHTAGAPIALGKGTADYATSPCRCLVVDLTKVGAVMGDVAGVSKISRVK